MGGYKVLKHFFAEEDSIKKVLSDYNIKEELIDLIIAIYGLTGKSCKPDKYREMIIIIKNSCDYSIMNKDMAVLFAALLIIKYPYPFSKVSVLVDIIERIRGAGFKSKVSNFMAFAIMDCEDVEYKINRALTIYRLMEDNHSVITGEDDYLATMYLTYLPMKAKDIGQIIKNYYKDLTAEHFRRGNALQTLSHLLPLILDKSYKEILEKVCLINEEIKKHKIKYNSSQYILLAIFTMFIEDVEVFIGNYKTGIEAFKEATGIKRLSTLQTIIVAMENMEASKEVESKFEVIDSEKRHFMEAALMMLVVEYLFRESLI